MTILLQHRETRAINEHKDVISVSTTPGDIAVAVIMSSVSERGIMSIDDARHHYIPATEEHGAFDIIHYDQSVWLSVITP